MMDLPALPGAYVLELVLAQDALLAVGRLGAARFPAGAVLYLGSAHGPGGLQGRLRRHLQADGNVPKHWHIDYLRSIAQVRAIGYVVQPGSVPAAPLECQWSQEMVKLPGSCVPMPGFGASDCRQGCPAHLVAFAGEEKDHLPLLDRYAWLQALARAAGAPLTIARSPA